MAKFKCPNCGTIVKRDLRSPFARTFLTKRGYKSYCEVKEPHRNVFLKPV